MGLWSGTKYRSFLYGEKFKNTIIDSHCRSDIKIPTLGTILNVESIGCEINSVRKGDGYYEKESG